MSPRDEYFLIPEDVQQHAKRATDTGERIRVTPSELIDLVMRADTALNGDSNDDEHDALFALRESLSDWYEDIIRRTRGR